MSVLDYAQRSSLSQYVEKITRVNVQKCYQCGKCSAGCPLAEDMDLPPSMVMRLLQTEAPENSETILRSKTIWLCLSCEMCLSRCPMEIDIPSVMDVLRHKSIKEKKAHKAAANIISFHKSFLNSIKFTGRLFELGLIIDYKRRSLNLTQDITLAPKMVSRGKLHFIPFLLKDRAGISGIFKKSSK